MGHKNKREGLTLACKSLSYLQARQESNLQPPVLENAGKDPGVEKQRQSGTQPHPPPLWTATLAVTATPHVGGGHARQSLSPQG